MAKNNFLSWDTVAASNTDIGGIGIQGSNNVSNFDNAFREMMAQLKIGAEAKTVYAVQTGSYTAVLADNNAVHRFTATATLVFATAATLGANWHYTVIASGADVTIDPSGGETINGLVTMIVPNGSTATIICDGSNFFLVIKPNGWMVIEKRSFSGVAAVDFTNLSAFKRLLVHGRVILSSSSSLIWRGSIDNGATYLGGASDYSFQGMGASGASVGSSLTKPASFGSIGNGSVSAYFNLELENWNVNGDGVVARSNASLFGTDIFGYMAWSVLTGTTTPRNALRIAPSTAVTLSGDILIEGSMA